MDADERRERISFLVGERMIRQRRAAMVAVVEKRATLDGRQYRLETPPECDSFLADLRKVYVDLKHAGRITTQRDMDVASAADLVLSHGVCSVHDLWYLLPHDVGPGEVGLIVCTGRPSRELVIEVCLCNAELVTVYGGDQFVAVMDVEESSGGLTCDVSLYERDGRCPEEAM